MGIGIKPLEHKAEHSPFSSPWHIQLTEVTTKRNAVLSNKLTIASTEDTEFLAPTEAAGLNAGDRPVSTGWCAVGSDLIVGVAVVERAGLLAASLATTTGDE
jgi:hypothetical protein